METREGEGSVFIIQLPDKTDLQQAAFGGVIYWSSKKGRWNVNHEYYTRPIHPPFFTALLSLRRHFWRFKIQIE